MPRNVSISLKAITVMAHSRIPVVDLFAGPGGLGEGFAAVLDDQGYRVFDIRTSIEKDPIAHQTLTLRSIFRSFIEHGRVPDVYYDYVRGYISQNEFYSDPYIAHVAQLARREAHCKTLGESPEEEIDKLILDAIKGDEDWVLIGGPPCQAYSVAGRSRRRNVDPTFEDDPKHFLYQEYLRIIRKFQPAVFIMENVKGMLSSTHKGHRIFDRILADLSQPAPGVKYEIRSFVKPAQVVAHEPEDFIIRAENHGVPQMRHRVILFGVRSDRSHLPHKELRTRNEQVSVFAALAGLPDIRGRISKEPDTFSNWLGALQETRKLIGGWNSPCRGLVEQKMMESITKAIGISSTGAEYVPGKKQKRGGLPQDLEEWMQISHNGDVYQHQSRSHMRSDLHRYFFASCYAMALHHSPKLAVFPKELLPKHKSAELDLVPFGDRFKVQGYSQGWNSPSTTVVSHIAKDGHYYIHPDPAQCRSLTVREAARLQTFPDNYFFEGNRTEQFHQVGNAVPPFLAKQLGESVAQFLGRHTEGEKPATRVLTNQQLLLEV